MTTRDNGDTPGPGGKDPVHRALDVFVYAPVGFALMAYQRVPGIVSDIVAKGLARVGEAEARMNQARMIGQVAVTYGSRQVRRDLDHRVAEARRRVEGLAECLPLLRSEDDEDDDLLAGPLSASPGPGGGVPPVTTAPPAPVGAAPPAPAGTSPFPPAPAAPSPPAPATASPSPPPAAAPSPPAPPPAAADLPIPEYDGLSASQVVSRLTGLTPAQLEAVAAYESAGRARKTVLGAIDRLRP